MMWSPWWLAAAIAALLPERARAVCEDKSKWRLPGQVAVQVDLGDLQVEVLCGEDAPAAAGRVAAARKTHIEFAGKKDLITLAEKIEKALGGVQYTLPDELDLGGPNERPRVLTTAGQYSRRAHSFAGKDEFALAIGELLRAFFRPGLDSAAKPKVEERLEDIHSRMKKYLGKKSSEGDLAELFDNLDMEDKGDTTDIDMAGLKRNYRELSVKYHPDKSPKHKERFNRIRDAYEILSDPVKILLYDTGGMEAVRKYEGSSNDITLGENVETTVSATLEDVYMGKVVSFRHRKRIICLSCRTQKNLPRCKKCPRCPGKMEQQQMWLNQHQYTVREVEVPSKDFCATKTQELDVTIERGALGGDTVTFKNEADQKPNEIPGHLIARISVSKHPRFTRAGNDLIVTEKISLLDALLGFERELVHLDGHKVYFGLPRGDVLKAGAVMVIHGEGMPIKDEDMFGRLIVRFEIEFPKSIPPSAADDLEKALIAVGMPSRKGRSEL